MKTPGAILMSFGGILAIVGLGGGIAAYGVTHSVGFLALGGLVLVIGTVGVLIGARSRARAGLPPVLTPKGSTVREPPTSAQSAVYLRVVLPVLGLIAGIAAGVFYLPTALSTGGTDWFVESLCALIAVVSLVALILLRRAPSSGN